MHATFDNKGYWLYTHATLTIKDTDYIYRIILTFPEFIIIQKDIKKRRQENKRQWHETQK